MLHVVFSILLLLVVQIEGAGTLFIVYGPSAAGKTTLVEQAAARVPQSVPLSRIVTYTTRMQRPYESNGKDYYFITQEEFEQKMRANFFSITAEYCNKSYGCPNSFLEDLKNGKNYIVILDYFAAKNMHVIVKDAILVRITAPLDALKKRIYARNTEDEQQIAKRLEHAKNELEQEAEQKLYHYSIENIDFEQSLQKFLAIIIDRIDIQKNNFL
jgi:guanylate kinase